jgi:hypothetical protein
MLIPLQLKHKLWTTVVLFHCCNLIWGLRNNNYSLSSVFDCQYTFVLYFLTTFRLEGEVNSLSESTQREVGRLMRENNGD